MTLRRIQCDQLRVGMYIHAFDGSWFDHPFWSRNSLLKRESDLETVLRSDIATLLKKSGFMSVVLSAKAKTARIKINASSLFPLR